MSTWHPPTKAGRQPTHETAPKGQSDSAVKRRPDPRGWTSLLNLNQDPPHETARWTILASTTWHTVEFSRNRRASARAFRLFVRGFVVLHLTGPSRRPRPPSRASGGGRRPIPNCAAGALSSCGSVRGRPPAGPATGIVPRCPFLPAGRHREHYAGPGAGGKSGSGDPRHDGVRAARHGVVHRPDLQGRRASRGPCGLHGSAPWPRGTGPSPGMSGTSCTRPAVRTGSARRRARSPLAEAGPDDGCPAPW